MATQVQFRGGSSTEHNSFTGAAREVTVDTTKDTVVVHDGSTAGGHPLQKQYPALGTASAPTYTFTGDVNTGIYSPGANQVAISTNGTGRLFVDSAGNVGVGTSSPTTRLTIGTPNNTTIPLRLFSSSSSGTIDIVGRSTTDKSHIQFYNYDGSTEQCKITSNSDFLSLNYQLAGEIRLLTSNTERMRIDSSGNVGIGTSSPAHNLDISPASGAAELKIAGAEGEEASIRLYADQGDDSADIKRLVTDTSGNFKIQHYSGSSFVDSMVIDSSGRMLLGTTTAPGFTPADNFTVSATNAGITVRSGTASTGSLAFSDGTGGGASEYRGLIQYSHVSNSLAFSTNSAERLRIDSSGRLLVGATAPPFDNGDAKLQIVSSSATSLVLARNDASVSAAQDVGSIRIFSNDGGSYQECARIAAEAESNYANDDKPTLLSFWTTSDGESSPTERLRINSSGRVGIGTTSPNERLHVESASNTTIRIDNEDDSTAQLYFHNTGSSDMDISVSSANMTFNHGVTERLRIDNSGNVIVGGTSTSSTNAAYISPNGTYVSNRVAGTNDLWNGKLNGTVTSTINADGNADFAGNLKIGDKIQHDGDNDTAVRFPANDTVSVETSGSERLRIDSSGRVLVGTTNVAPGDNNNTTGIALDSNGRFYASADGDHNFNKTADGVILAFRSAGVNEGAVSISGTTVTYGGGHLARWSQLLDNADPSGILKGTVMSNLDEMCDWGEEDNEQLNRTKISDIEGDSNVAGVFVSTSFNDEGPFDFYVGMTGDMVIRIAQGTTVARGDLLMSAGDGTAKSQDDDIVRSKTIAKVTSTNVSETYADGSYCVPCVLMAC